MKLEILLTWWNLIYVVPFLLALIYLLVYTISGVTFGEVNADADMDGEAHLDLHADADVDADADTDADAHVETEFHVDADADADADTDADTDAEADAGHDAGGAHDTDHGGSGGRPILAALSLVGVGKVPLSIVMLILLITWGVIGFGINQLVFPALQIGWLTALFSLPAALVGSVAITGGASRLVARWMPTTETYVHKRSDLVGRSGQAMYDIDENFGQASVHDHNGDLFQVHCRIAPGKPKIGKGARVVLFDYDEEKGVFYAALFPAEMKPAAKKVVDLAAEDTFLPDAREASKERQM